MSFNKLTQKTMQGVHKYQHNAAIVGASSSSSELKDDLCTVVDALGVLQDFIESVFGAKFQSFCGDQQQQNNRNRVGNSRDPRDALRELRWKNFNSSRGAARKLSDPGPGMSSSSFNLNRSSSTEVGDSLERVALMVGEPEIVNIKCEVNCTEEVLPDFLDDVDPFSGGGAGYDYEGDPDPDINISSSYEISGSSEGHLKLNHQQQSIQSSQQQSPDEGGLQFKGSNNNNSILTSPNAANSSRFIPGLIPIQSDPLKNPDPDSESLSSENSDKDWHPTSSSSPSKKKDAPKRKRKRVGGPSVTPPQKRSSSNSTPSTTSTTSATGMSKPAQVLSGKTTIHPVPPPAVQINHVRQHNHNHHQHLHQHNPGGFINRSSSSGSSSSSSPNLNLTSGEGGPFKCGMCSASYKQEESLKSHQKYKHNPSRVQCQCPLCGKSMVDKYRLQRHLRLHTGEKPFECQHCGQSFYRKDYHTKHMQRKHGLQSSTSTTASTATTTTFPTTTSTSRATNPSSSSPTSSGGNGKFGSPKKSSNSSLISSPTITSGGAGSRARPIDRPNAVNVSTPFVARGLPIVKQEPGMPTKHSYMNTTTTEAAINHVTTSSSPSETTATSASSSSTYISTNNNNANARESHSLHTNFIDYFSGFGSALGGGGVGGIGGSNVGILQEEASSTSTNSIGISSSSLMTMTSLTFDDLISADL